MDLGIRQDRHLQLGRTREFQHSKAARNSV